MQLGCAAVVRSVKRVHLVPQTVQFAVAVAALADDGPRRFHCAVEEYGAKHASPETLPPLAVVDAARVAAAAVAMPAVFAADLAVAVAAVVAVGAGDASSCSVAAFANRAVCSSLVPTCALLPHGCAR